MKDIRDIIPEIEPYYLKIRELVQKCSEISIEINQLNIDPSNSNKIETETKNLENLQNETEMCLESLLQIIRNKKELIQSILNEKILIDFCIYSWSAPRRKKLKALLKEFQNCKICRGNQSLVLEFKETDEDSSENFWIEEETPDDIKIRAEIEEVAKKEEIEQLQLPPEPISSILIEKIDQKTERIYFKLEKPESWGIPILKYRVTKVDFSERGELLSKKKFKFDSNEFNLKIGSNPSYQINFYFSAENKFGAQEEEKILSIFPPQYSNEVFMSGLGENMLKEFLEVNDEKTQEDDIQLLKIPQKISFKKSVLKEFKPIKIFSNDDSTVCLCNNYQLLTWGTFLDENSNLALFDKNLPLTEPVSRAALGKNFMVVLTLKGELLTCGINNYSQLGNGNQLHSPELKKISTDGKQMKEIACGLFHTLTLSLDGGVYSWGYKQAPSGAAIYNSYNEAINYSNEEFDQPRPFRISKSFEDSADPVCKISAGNYHSGFLTKKGKCFLFGDNLKKQVCSGVHFNYALPVSVSLDGWRALDLACGNSTTVILVENKEGERKLLGWGSNKFGYFDSKLEIIKEKLEISSEGLEGRIEKIWLSLVAIYILTDKNKLYCKGKPVESGEEGYKEWKLVREGIRGIDAFYSNTYYYN